MGKDGRGLNSTALPTIALRSPIDIVRPRLLAWAVGLSLRHCISTESGVVVWVGYAGKISDHSLTSHLLYTCMSVPL